MLSCKPVIDPTSLLSYSARESYWSSNHTSLHPRAWRVRGGESLRSLTGAIIWLYECKCVRKDGGFLEAQGDSGQG